MERRFNRGLDILEASFLLPASFHFAAGMLIGSLISSNDNDWDATSTAETSLTTATFTSPIPNSLPARYGGYARPAYPGVRCGSGSYSGRPAGGYRSLYNPGN